MKKVFISYSSKNRDFAERVARDLSDAGLDVWIDFRRIVGVPCGSRRFSKVCPRLILLSPASPPMRWKAPGCGERSSWHVVRIRSWCPSCPSTAWSF
ncbi:MAG: toll/interleukin-1 receptor domain-containing protein [Chloroflexi bacterium]|nr:toll/interleukin-1 receptor domain-containing protein [Chloroflexota bacterium]